MRNTMLSPAISAMQLHVGVDIVASARKGLVFPSLNISLHSSQVAFFWSTRSAALSAPRFGGGFLHDRYARVPPDKHASKGTHKYAQIPLDTARMALLPHGCMPCPYRDSSSCGGALSSRSQPATCSPPPGAPRL